MRLVTGLFMSLDGIVEADDDWQFAYFDEELFQGIAAGWARAGAALMGRRTYQGYARLRVEHPESPAVTFLDGIPKYVVSQTLETVEWPGTTLLRADLLAQVAQLRRRPGPDVLVLGSPTLVRWLFGHGLLDELSFSVLPIIVGSGVRLFQDMELAAGRVGLRLQNATTLGSGVLELRYTPEPQEGEARTQPPSVRSSNA